MNNSTPTKDLYFIDIVNPHTGEKISGAHTGTSAGRYAHIELDDLYNNRIDYQDYVDKVRDWADVHIEGRTDSLPGYFRRGEELPEYLRQNEDEEIETCKTSEGR